MKQSPLKPSIYTEEYAEKTLSGTDRFTEDLVDIYFYNLIKNTPGTSPFAHQICHQFEIYRSFYAIDNGLEGSERKEFPCKPKKKGSARVYDLKGKPKAGEVDPRDWQMLGDYFERKIAKQSSDGKTNIESNISILAETIGLSEIEQEVLVALHVIYNEYDFNEVLKELVKKNPAKLVPLLSRMLNRPKEIAEIAKVLDPNGMLYTAGIVTDNDMDDPDDIFPMIDGTIDSVISAPTVDETYLVENLVGKPFEAKLNTSDFPTFNDDIAHILEIIKNAVEKGEKGINILLYGPQGSGKTELAQALAAELGLSLYGVGEQEPKDHEKKDTSRHRTSKLLQAHSFLKGNKKAILFFDEVEDVLMKGTDSSKKADTPNKILFNRLLEENPIVTIWAGNDIDKFHESVRGRFNYVLHVDYQPTLVRQNVWNRQAKINGVSLNEDEILSLARRFQAPPRMITNALRLASLNGAGIDNIIAYMKASSKILYGSTEAIEPITVLSDKYDLDLIGIKPASEQELKELLKIAPDEISSTFIQGPAGSGILSLASYLAEKRLKNLAIYDARELLAKNPMAPPASKIRNAFSDAVDSKSYLLITNMEEFSDNPDSHSSKWDQDGLTELFLECAYNAEVPMIVSSYRTDVEFPSSLRNAFLSHLELQTLSRDQAAKASEVYFGEAVSGLPDNLVPLDFSRVSKLKKKSPSMSNQRISENLGRQMAARVPARKLGIYA